LTSTRNTVSSPSSASSCRAGSGVHTEQRERAQSSGLKTPTSPIVKGFGVRRETGKE
jgi:hypothetical protein